MRSLFIKHKSKYKIFSQYPCVVYLHNALRFIDEKNLDVAYEEICYALLKSGNKLSVEEKTKFENIQKKIVELRG